MNLSRLFKSKPEPTETVPQVAVDERIYAVGDIHGRHDLLISVLQEIDHDARQMQDDRRMHVVFLGDYVDRGDDAAQVIETLMQLCDGTQGRIQCLKGNHEDALLRFLDDPVVGKSWLDFGAAQTLTSYGVRMPKGQPNSDALHGLAQELEHAMGPHVAFLRNMPLFFTSGDVVCVHAGMNPEDGRDVSALLWGHSGFLKPFPVPGLRIVHGHFDDLDPVVHPGRICVDTGAYYSGTLTAVRLDDQTTFLKAQTKGLD